MAVCAKFTENLTKDESILLSLTVGKFNKFGWNQPRIFVLT